MNRPDGTEEIDYGAIQQVFESWMQDGETWIGIFQNQAFDSGDFGQRVAMAFDNSQFEEAEVGKTTAPDNKAGGLGWKYILVKKCRTAEAAMEATHPKEMTP